MATTLKKRLIHEFRKNGKKTVLLGILMLVGCYFWLPMLWEALVPQAPAGTSAAEAPAEPSADRAKAGPTKLVPLVDPDTPLPPSIDEPSANWQELQTLLSHQTIQPRDWAAEMRDPFSREWLVGQRTAIEPQVEDEKPVAEVPLVCYSILFGENKRLAIINDEVYGEGSLVAAGTAIYRVIRIERSFVLLESNGEQHRLSLTGSEGPAEPKAPPRRRGTP